MTEYQIVVVVGSLRRESFNRQLANAVTRLAPPEFKFQHLKIDDLPLYNQDDDANPAAAVKRIKSEIKAARGLLFFTPEYNRSYSGVLKNALDHASRPYGQNAWDGKPAGIMSISIGPAGASMAQQHLRNVLAYLNVPTMNQPEAYLQNKEGLFGSNGEIANADSKKFLQGWMDKYIVWVKQHVT